ncbi:putative zinc-binding oxidoreductase ToxD [Tricladium varicosporioides]|nr:putative zinc-binding oxidoreductase ToxD [Hymenoscyphus varicosporioides]
MAPLNRGLIKSGVGKASVVTIPIPLLRPDYLLVKTIVVALNPTDWQTLDEEFTPGTSQNLLGCDVAGIVLEIGPAVTKTFKVGDRVAGVAHGGNDIQPDDGTFAKFILLKGDIAIHIPEHMSFEQASTLGGGIAAVALSMYRDLPLRLPELPIGSSVSNLGQNSPYLLIYGGSTATGTLAIQFAKLSGLRVISTCSPRNFKLLKALGVDHVLDYSDPQCGPKIRELTSNKLLYVLDTIAVPSSAEICAEALSSSPEGIYVNLMDIQSPRKDVTSIFPLGYTVLGEEFVIESTVWPASVEDFELAKEFFTLTEKLLDAGYIKPHPVSARSGGLDSILAGMQELKEGKVSGAKLVYRIDES